MPITIQEIIASDTISQLVDKTNFNFDQLLLNGGGPAGPIGPSGPVGPAGGRGPKGTRWYEDTSSSAPGANPTSTYPTSTPLEGDYYLQFNGQVWEYNGTTWVITTIDLEGPQGPQGVGGGMGDTFGSPTIGLQTAIYNGPIGEGTGATSGNEGVPSVMIGGAVSTTIPLGSIPLTNAYIIPDAVADKMISSTASLLIHQKDSAAKSIVFHGGAANLNDNYQQANLSSLCNITIGVDDRLILSAPKVATTPTTVDELVGFEVSVPARSQSFSAGKAITFQTGQRSNEDFSGENSDFSINVGTGSNPPGNKFSLTTAGTSGATLFETGAGFPVVTEQNSQVGVTQFRSGLFNVTTSANQNIQLNSAGQLKLDTTLGSSTGGAIQLTSASGGIIASALNGNIDITQSDGSVTATGDIRLINNSTAPNSTVGGDIYIMGNSQIILRKETTLASPAALNACSIVIDYGYDGSAGAQPHTRFVGRQTIAGEGQSGTFPPSSFGNLIYKNPTGQATTATAIYELTGNNGVTDYSPGAMLQAWTGGTQATTGLDAGLLAITMGSEGPQSPVPAANFAWDNTLGFSVRDSGNNNEYFTASKNKIAFATPWVLKRATGRNSSINSAPTTTVSTSSTAPAPLNYGWNTRQDLTPQYYNNFPSSGMPQTEELTVPFISLNFGPGLGYTEPGASFNNGNNINFDYKVAFPIGAYPGQRLMIKLYVQALQVDVPQKSGPGVSRAQYGSVDLRIPQYRIKSPKSTGNWTSWWGPFSPNLALKPSYQVVTVSTDSTDAGNGVGRYKMIDCIWDGQYVTQTGANANLGEDDAFTTQTQHGWGICGISINSTDNGLVTISGYDNSPGCFVAGTEISLANGDTKNIEDIIPGEEVITWNENTKTPGVGTVGGLDVIEEVGMVIVLTFDNGSTIKATEHHPFYHIDGENVGLIDAAELKEGFEVYQLNGEKAKVVSTKEEQGMFKVYNVTNVSGGHNYYANEILVHNKGGL